MEWEFDDSGRRRVTDSALGQVRFRLGKGDIDGALEFLRESAEGMTTALLSTLEQDSRPMRVNLARLLLRANDAVNAAKCAESGEDYVLAARAYERAGQMDDAARCRVIAASDPRAVDLPSRSQDVPTISDERSYLKDAVRAWRRNRPDEARQVLETVPESHSEHVASLMLLAELDVGDGRMREAISRLTRAVARRAHGESPIEAEAAYKLGVLLLESGLGAQAVKAFEFVLGFDPAYKDAFQRLLAASGGDVRREPEPIPLGPEALTPIEAPLAPARGKLPWELAQEAANLAPSLLPLPPGALRAPEARPRPRAGSSPRPTPVEASRTASEAPAIGRLALSTRPVAADPLAQLSQTSGASSTPKPWIPPAFPASALPVAKLSAPVPATLPAPRAPVPAILGTPIVGKPIEPARSPPAPADLAPVDDLELELGESEGSFAPGIDVPAFASLDLTDSDETPMTFEPIELDAPTRVRVETDLESIALEELDFDVPEESLELQPIEVAHAITPSQEQAIDEPGARVAPSAMPPHVSSAPAPARSEPASPLAPPQLAPGAPLAPPQLSPAPLAPPQLAPVAPVESSPPSAVRNEAPGFSSILGKLSSSLGRLDSLSRALESSAGIDTEELKAALSRSVAFVGLDGDELLEVARAAKLLELAAGAPAPPLARAGEPMGGHCVALSGAPFETATGVCCELGELALIEPVTARSVTITATTKVVFLDRDAFLRVADRRPRIGFAVAKALLAHLLARGLPGND
ncbi:MAG: hypothetical protein HY791_01430 [Deltaproteobacteria bacterium]|nr:hypothetical protein [Deltaproteobacteria bacterium]